eukprot:COSAG04_NODE_9312_length_875_cov_172.452320_1_plen_157_part_10
MERRAEPEPEPEPEQLLPPLLPSRTDLPSFVVAGPHELRHWAHMSPRNRVLHEPEPELEPEPEPEPQPQPQPQPQPHQPQPQPQPQPEPEPEPQTETHAQTRSPTAAEFCDERTGISLDGLRHLAELLGPRLTAETTTSDVCHAFIKPMTTPDGWAD